MTKNREFTPDDEEEIYYGEASITPEVIDLRPTPPLPVITDLFAERPALDPMVSMHEFTNEIAFDERHSRLKIVSDLVGLRRVVDGRVESYRDKLTRAERSGKHESARFGMARILGERAVVYLLDWDYFAGSLGEVAGEKFVRAAELAEREKVPFVSFGASSGVRQHENVLGLVQMQRMAVAASKYQHNANHPYISVLAGQVWGGMSASAVPVADMVVALEGTNYGFAGSRVIETFEGKPVAKGAQSAEANLLDRNIDVVVKDVPELLDFLGSSLRRVRESHSAKPIPAWHRQLAVDTQVAHRPLSFGENGFYASQWARQQHSRTVLIPRDRRDTPTMTEREQLMARYREIAASSGRIDSEFIMQHSFDSATPIYNAVQFEGTKRYPGIIASVASIGEQSFMVIGNQPSYKNSSGNYVGKQAANPGPADFEYAVRMMKAAERWQLPLVFLTDTLGALPTMEAERRGQSRAIAESIKTAGSHPYPTISVITGAMGSGGGLATTPFGRETIMLDSALGFVSEPSSMASILYNVAHPTDEQVAMTLETVRASAADLQSQGLVDTVVHDDDNPHQTAQGIRAAIVDALARQQGKSPRKLRHDTSARLSPRMIQKHRSE